MSRAEVFMATSLRRTLHHCELYWTSWPLHIAE